MLKLHSILLGARIDDEDYKIKKRKILENLELGPLFKPKIDELVEKRNKSKPEEKSKRKLL
jgi:hypothetical protein